MRKYKDKWAIILAVLMFVAYLLTMSCSLDDVDAASFALAIDEFDIAKFQPQPPGHPGHVFLSKAFYLVFRDHLLAMTVKSALFGSLSIIAFYFLAKEMLNRKAALYSSMLLAVTPIFWLNSLKAMSDMTSLFFLLLSMLFIYRYIKRKRAADIYIASAVSGLSVGIRFPMTAFILLPLIAYAFISVKEERKKRILISAGLFALAVLLWLVPTLWINGAVTYFKKTFSIIFISRYYMPGEAIIQPNFSAGLVLSQALGFAINFLLGGYGVNIELITFLDAALLSLLAAAAVLAALRIKVKDQRLHFFLIGLLPYLLAVFIFLPPRDARHLLPAFPAITLMLLMGIAGLKRYRKIFFALILALMIAHSLPLALKIHNEAAPPVQSIEYVMENYDLNKTILITPGFSDRYCRFYCGGLEYHMQISEKKIMDYLLWNYTVVVMEKSDYLNTIPFDYTLLRTFSRDPRVHAKHSEESIYTLSMP